MSPTLFAALLLAPLFLFFLAERSRRKSVSRKIPQLPSLPGLPFIGNLHELGSLRHQSLSRLSKKHGPLMLLHLGSIPTLVVSSSSYAQEFMKTHDNIFASRPSFRVSRALSYNHIDVAFSPYGDCWRQMRKICMTHLLSAKMVHSIASVRREEVAGLLQRVSDRNGTVVCLTEMLNELVNNVLCRVVLGSPLGDQRRKLVSNLVQRNSTINTILFMEDFFPRLGWLDRIFGSENKIQSHFGAWDVLFDEFIEDHLTNKSTNYPSAERDMFAAGIGTSFLVLDWSMSELIRNPRVMKKLQDEVRSIPAIESTQDCEIAGYRIPKKTRVIINAWSIGRDEQYWEAPEEFNPERFVGSSLDFKGREFRFIPFGAGRRMCPGITFATAVVELTLANLLHRFDWRLPSGISIEDMVMEESPGLVAPRKQKLELVPILVNKAT
ncbi:Cytochrome P450 71A9 [Platanthera zijinensis]|uniref:Cytochrome P450 71A9 n=1 Tax=Platanthera zijinensis TaxID=2320716 RepID=A0AAP0FZU2_9ASPA